MPRSETTLSKEIVKAIRALPGGWARKIHSSGSQGAGLPDIAAVYRGRAVWIETKRPGEEPSRIQRATIDDLRRAGAIAGVATSVDEALNLIRLADLVDPAEL